MLHGLKRLVLLLACVVGAVLLIDWFVAWHWNRSFEHILPTVFYFAGAEVGATRETAISTSLFFGCLAVFLFGLGIALDYLL